MNKTVNINLSGIFFHIDEDAYLKLQTYLEAVKRSFSNTHGSEEIFADIEARIAELFGERLKTERQVINSRDVDEVISIMGQPEDYAVDEEIFEEASSDANTPRTKKELYRDVENSYLGGVSSGLAHYMGIRAIWMRLLWILLTLGSSGAFILIYIALWIFIPEAKTTAEKLAMRGEPVNISNIERKIKEGFDDVSGKVKDFDYEKYGYRARKGAESAATGIGSIIAAILNVFVKLIGILIILIAGSVLISLFIGLFTVGTFGIIDAPWTDYLEMATSGVGTLWVLSVLSFLAVGIPFFFLFLLGMKILLNNLKSIGKTAKLVLLGLWILSILGWTLFGIMQATERAYDGEVVITEELPVTTTDTLFLGMVANPEFKTSSYRNSEFKIKYNENNEKVIFSEDIRIIVRASKDSTGKIDILKTAEGKNHKDARERAEAIAYDLDFSNNELLLNSYFITNIENKFRDQEVQVILYLPIGSVLYAANNTRSFHRNYGDLEDIRINGDEERFLRITETGTECLDCPANENEEWEDSEEEWDLGEEEFSARVDIDGKEINLKINKDGIRVNDQQTSMLKVDKDGIEIRKN